MTTTRGLNRHRYRLPLAVLAALAAILVLGATANAATFCVQDPACPAGGTPKGTPAEAMTAANADGFLDTVRIGPGTYNTTGLGIGSPVEIVGAGKEATELVETDAGIALMLSANSSASDLSVRITQPVSFGIWLNDGADATRVRVTGPDSVTQSVGIRADELGSVLNDVSVDLADRGDVYGVYSIAGGQLRDSDITAGIGIVGNEPALAVRRTVIRANTGLWAFGGSLNASNVLITRHPRPMYPGFTGVEVMNGNDGSDATLMATHVTIDGGTPDVYRRGIAVSSVNNANVTTGKATATIESSIVRGVNSAIYQDGDSPTESATLNLAYSSYDGSNVHENANGGLVLGAGNRADNPDPKFFDPAAGDYRLRWDSPLLDRGRPTPFLQDEDPDLATHQRVRDSDGNGSALRDMGAYEYQRVAPQVTATVAPLEGPLGTAMAFDATGSDPDGDPLAYSWNFGDGSGGAGTHAGHVYGAPGSYQATVTATDPTGLSATASQSAAVTAEAAQSGPTGSQPGGDHVAPVLSGLTLSPKRFTARRSSRVTYRLSEAARLTLVVQRATRRKGRTVFVRYARAERSAAAGANRLTLRRRVGSRRLVAGRYRITLVARDSAANRSNVVRASFTVRG
jgi:hypothetical protein